MAAGFPVTADTFLSARVDGVHALATTLVEASCAGFSDTSASCVAENFPTDLVIEGSAAEGYRARSSWFEPIPLALGEGGWVGQGPVVESVSNTCGGAANATTIELRVGATGLLPDEVSGGWVAASIAGSFTVSSPGTDACVAARRTAEFVTAVG